MDNLPIWSNQYYLGFVSWVVLKNNFLLLKRYFVFPIPVSVGQSSAGGPGLDGVVLYRRRLRRLCLRCRQDWVREFRPACWSRIRDHATRPTISPDPLRSFRPSVSWDSPTPHCRSTFHDVNPCPSIRQWEIRRRLDHLYGQWLPKRHNWRACHLAGEYCKAKEGSASLPFHPARLWQRACLWCPSF